MSKRRGSQVPERHYKHIRTNEDWYPTMPPYCKSINTQPWFNNTLDSPAVCVGATNQVPSDEHGWKVAVWGADDFGLERYNLSRIEAFELFNLISDFTTQQDLKDLGFVYV